MASTRFSLRKILLGAALLVACAAPARNVTSTQESIGAAGGKAALSDGSGVTIPAGALTSDVTVTVAEAPTAPAPTGAIEVGTPIDFGPEGQTFAKPVTVTLAVNTSKLLSGMTISDVVVMTAPVGGTQYTQLTTTAVDATHVSVQTTHFSTYIPVQLIPGPTCDGGVGVTSSSQFAVVIATVGNDIVTIPYSQEQSGAFAVAIQNQALTATTVVTLSVDVGTLPLMATACQTAPNGECLSPPAASVQTTVSPCGSETFSVFLTASATISNSPSNQVTVTLTDSNQNVVGSASVAVDTD